MTIQEANDALLELFTKQSFTIDEYLQMRRTFGIIDKATDRFRHELYDIERVVDKSDWTRFLEKLPVVEASTDTQTDAIDADATDAVEKEKTLLINNQVWTWDCESSIKGIPCQVYVHEDDFLYLFEGGHYFKESEYGDPDLMDVPHCERYERT